MESLYRGHRFPPEIISHAIWLYHRFTLSFRDVEDLLAERSEESLSPTKRSDTGVRNSDRPTPELCVENSEDWATSGTWMNSSSPSKVSASIFFSDNQDISPETAYRDCEPESLVI